jgi:hypothetical protein
MFSKCPSIVRLRSAYQLALLYYGKTLVCTSNLKTSEFIRILGWTYSLEQSASHALECEYH